MKDLIIVGSFGETIELAENLGKTIVGIIDKDPNTNLYGYSYLGSDNHAGEVLKVYPKAELIIAPDLPVIRKKLSLYYTSLGFKIGQLISKRAIISKHCKIGKGAVIADFVNVSSNVILGDFVKLNVGANIMHDCVIGDYSTVAPNATILGRVKVSNECYIGANSTILPENEIGKNSIVGAGAVVTKKVYDGMVVKGIPAK